MRYSVDEFLDRAIEDLEFKEFVRSLGFTDPRDVLVFLIAYVQYSRPLSE